MSEFEMVPVCHGVLAYTSRGTDDYRLGALARNGKGALKHTALTSAGGEALLGIIMLHPGTGQYANLSLFLFTMGQRSSTTQRVG
jgi:hypothetical protein